MLQVSVNCDQISSTELDAVRQRFYSEGLSVADWARSHGFSSQLTYSLLAGRLRARRGEAHRIAVALGLKPDSHSQKMSSVGYPTGTRLMNNRLP
jgi:gp16 family phage-associated protein